MYARAGEPKKLVVLKGFGHYEVYGGEAFRQVMDETVAWYKTHLPARSRAFSTCAGASLKRLAALAPERMKAQDRVRERRRSVLWQQIRPEKERAARKIGRSREIAIRPQ